MWLCTICQTQIVEDILNSLEPIRKNLPKLNSLSESTNKKCFADGIIRRNKCIKWNEDDYEGGTPNVDYLSNSYVLWNNYSYIIIQNTFLITRIYV